MKSTQPISTMNPKNGNRSTFSNFSLTQVPEPSTALLGGLGMLALRRRRRN